MHTHQKYLDAKFIIIWQIIICDSKSVMKGSNDIYMRVSTACEIGGNILGGGVEKKWEVKKRD